MNDECQVSRLGVLDFLELCSLLPSSLAIVLQDEAYSVSFVEHTNARGLERARVNEYVLATVI